MDELVIMEAIGRGGFGTVYKALYKRTVCAFKVRAAAAEGCIYSKPR